MNTGSISRADQNASYGHGEAREAALARTGGQILVGDVRDVLRGLEKESVHCVVTSPPYWSLRSYSTDPQVWGGSPDCAHAWLEPVTAKGISGGTNQGGKIDNPNGVTYRPVPPTQSVTCRHCGAWRGELGGEPTPEAYVEHIVEVFREVRRVLRRDGTVWVNLGDSYNNNSPTRSKASEAFEKTFTGGLISNGTRRAALRTNGLKPKDLVGIPWRVAFALRADGWYLRQDIIWNKPAPMPEPVQDRMTKSHEYVFLLAKSSRYYFDPIAIAEPASADPITVARNGRADTGVVGASALHGTEDGQSGRGGFDRAAITTRNKRSVWTINTEPTSINHFATFPEKLVEPCILAGTSERGVCRECGAPWRRVVEKPASTWEQRKADGAPMRVGTAGSAAVQKLNGRDPKWQASQMKQTTGWQPSCKHDGDPVPATVLDCFLGSGTTGRVAERLGRRWIGIELNENYAEIARRRTAQLGLLQWAGGGE